MIRRASLNVSLTPELMAFIAAQAVRTSLRLLDEKERPAPAPPRIGAPRKTAPGGR